MKKKSWDEYEIKARYIPVFISVIPIVHFLILFVGMSFWKELIVNISWMIVIANFSLSLIVMLAVTQIQSSLGKFWIEDDIFGKGGENFPTTNMLLYDQGIISKERKKIIRTIISEDSKFSFSSERDERDDPENARLKAREAVSYVRGKVGSGIHTIQYNIRYGFFRNLIAGSIWCCIGSLGCSVLYFLQNKIELMSLFLLYFAVFIVLFVLRKKILEKLAFDYADTLYNEFLSLIRGKK